MNLYKDGAHAAADWINVKLRATQCELAVFLRDDGLLMVHETRRWPRIPAGQHVGTYRMTGITPFTYKQAVGDMEVLRREHYRPDSMGVGITARRSWQMLA